MAAEMVRGYSIDLRRQGEAEVETSPGTHQGSTRRFEVFEAA